MVLNIKIKSNYGTEAIYIQGKEAEHIARLTGKKTIDRKDIEALKALGFTFNLVNDLITI